MPNPCPNEPTTRDDSARNAVIVQAPAATATFEGAPGIRAVHLLPLAWMVRGFVLALDRLRRAAPTPEGTARDGLIALFEASNWLVSIDDRVNLTPDAPDAYITAFRFVRNRTHHQWAAGVTYDEPSRTWMWRPAENLPVPSNPRFHDPNGERAYVDVFAGRAVAPTLKHVQAIVVDRAER